MANKTSNKRYTYVNFANEAIAIANGTTPENIERFIEKANDLLATQAAKAAYNKEHPKASKAKGASDTTKAMAAEIAAVLTAEPKTGAEINETLGSEYSALAIANAVKFIDGATSTKVVRPVTRTLKSGNVITEQKEYTGYSIN